MEILYFILPNQKITTDTKYECHIIIQEMEYISDDLHVLHWLPMAAIIKFSYIVLVYKVLNGQEPSYLSSLIQWYAQ